MTHIKSFTVLLGITFALPLFILILLPHMGFRDLSAVAYSEDELEFAEGSVYPPGVAGRVTNGRDVYQAEGCAYCHTQMVRPTKALGFDAWRKGWTGRGPNWEGDEGKPVPNRLTRPEDYLGEDYAFLGIQRNGPDLSNVGWRITSEEEVHRHLYSPRSVNIRSNMPGFKHLYKVQQIGGGPSDEALKLEGEHAAKDGYEVIPTAKAEALASYLMSLKKDFLVPASAGGPGVNASAPAAAADAGAPTKP